MTVNGVPRGAPGGTDVPVGHEGAVAIRRFVNESIAAVAENFEGGASVFEFVCECGNLRCAHVARLTLAEYHRVAPGSVLAHGRLVGLLRKA